MNWQGNRKASWHDRGAGGFGIKSGEVELVLERVLKDLTEVYIAFKGGGIEPRRESDGAVTERLTLASRTDGI